MIYINCYGIDNQMEWSYTIARWKRLWTWRRLYACAYPEIIDYAQYIGLVLPEDNKYLFIAKEGLKAKLPPFW